MNVTNHDNAWNLRRGLSFWGLFFFWWMGMAVYAVSAYPGWIRHCCPDGTFANLKLKGDEYHKWAVTEDGYTLLRDSEGDWCFAVEDSKGIVGVSDWKLSAVRPKELSVLLRKTPKGLAIRPDILRSEKSMGKGRRKSAAPLVGKWKTLVVLVQFPDREMASSRESIDALFNRTGFREDGAAGSVKDFFRESSYGMLDLECDLQGPFTASKKMAYYGGNEKNGQDGHPEELFLEALDFLSGKVNLADYAGQDGYLNNIHLIFAGYGEEAGGPAEAIWSHEATFNEPLEIGGVKIMGYSCAPELRGNRGSGLSRIGVHCHEIGHSFGAMDFYDTDYEVNGEYAGTGQWDLMASGNWNNEGISPAHFNPYVKTMFGWTGCEILAGGDGMVLPASLEHDKVYRIDTGTEGDYFLLENRRQIGFDAALPGSGLMIYHILPQIEERSVGNMINTTYPQTCYPVCAGTAYSVPGKNPVSYGNVNGPECPFPGKNAIQEFTSNTIPAAISSEGRPAFVGLKNIREEDDGTIRFDVTAGEEGTPGIQKLPFAESFEEDDTGWSFEQLEGKILWEISGSEVYGSALEAADGKRYLKMNGKKGLLGPLSIARAISPMIRNEAGKTTLSFMFHNEANFSVSGTLNVLYRGGAQKDWLPIASFSERNEGWKQYKEILFVTEEDFQIAFEGEMEAGLLLLDDIKVYSDAATSTLPVPLKSALLTCYGMKGKVCVESDRPALFRVYDLAGMLIYSGILNTGMNRIGIKPGLYVGVCENAVSKFYVY